MPKNRARVKFAVFHNSDVADIIYLPEGRDAWALRQLICAGRSGVTPIHNPAPRWSAYVHNLRTKYGIDIETVHEPHGGDYPGTHAIYVLRSRVHPAGLLEVA